MSLRLALLALLAAGCQPAAPDTSSPVTTSDGGPMAGALGAALTQTPDGTLAVWVEGEGGDRRLLARAPGADAIEVFTGPVSTSNQAGPRVASSPDGAVYLAFVQEQTIEGRRFPASTLWLTRSDDGRAWSAPVRVHPDPGFATGHTFHDLAVGPDGTVYVSWLDGTARDRWLRTQTAMRDDERPPVRLASERHAAPHQHGQDAASPSHDTPSAADPGSAEPGTDLVVARSTDGGRTFETPVELASGTCQCCRTALAATDDAVYASWRHIFPGGERDIALARSDDGGRTWGAPTRVWDDGWAIDACPHAGPALAARADGALVVAWPTGADGRSGIWSTVTDDRGATFASPTPLVSDGPFGLVAAARDGEGRVWLAWENRRTTEVRLTRPGSGDTLSVTGSAPALTGTPTGWHLARSTPDGLQITSGTP